MQRARTLVGSSLDDPVRSPMPRRPYSPRPHTKTSGRGVVSGVDAGSEQREAVGQLLRGRWPAERVDAVIAASRAQGCGWALPGLTSVRADGHRVPPARRHAGYHDAFQPDHPLGLGGVVGGANAQLACEAKSKTYLMRELDLADAADWLSDQ